MCNFQTPLRIQNFFNAEIFPNYGNSTLHWRLEDVAQWLQEATSKWNVEGRVIAIARDNSGNMNGAVQNRGWEAVPCFAHAYLAVGYQQWTQLESSQQSHCSTTQVGRAFEAVFDATTTLNEKQQQMYVPRSL